MTLPAPTPPSPRLSGPSWRRATLWLLVGGVGYAVVWGAAALAPGALEGWAAFVTPRVVRPLSLLGALVPFSVGEVGVAVWVAWLVRAAVRGVREVGAGRDGVWRVVGAGAARLTRDAGVLLLAFNFLWGFNYARPSVETRGDWPAWEGVGPEELARLTGQVVAATNRAYLDLHGVEDLGTPTTLESWPELESSVDRAWDATVESLPLGEAAQPRHGRAKRPWVSPLLRRMGVAGMYFPFAGEAWVVRGVPASLVSNTLAHEKAHQRGVAGEADAGFLAVAVGSAADHPHARYGAALYAQLQLMGALGRADRQAWTHLAESRIPGVVRDLEDVHAYWARYRGRARAVRVAVNDAYLRAHGVRAGIADYGRTVELLVRWARLHDGTVLTGP